MHKGKSQDLKGTFEDILGVVYLRPLHNLSSQGVDQPNYLIAFPDCFTRGDYSKVFLKHSPPKEYRKITNESNTQEHLAKFFFEIFPSKEYMKSTYESNT